jgi:hypothetical protein
MIKCSFCDSTYVENTVFCSECGTSLLQNNSTLRTNQLHTNEIGWVGEAKLKEPVAVKDPTAIKTSVMRLSIGEGRRLLEIPLQKTIHIGRVDSVSEIFPEVDVSDAPEAKGVSRRHVRVFRQTKWVVIEDLGSVNGTYLNGKRLDPYIPEQLSSGDIIQLGKLLIEVTLTE